MPCYQSSGLPSGVATAGRTAYATEAACLEACKEGACCETENGVTTCSVKPQCQCQGTGKVFKGIGTTCSPYPCCFCPQTGNPPPVSVTVSLTPPPEGCGVAVFPSFLEGSHVVPRYYSGEIPAGRLQYYVFEEFGPVVDTGTFAGSVRSHKLLSLDYNCIGEFLGGYVRGDYIDPARPLTSTPFSESVRAQTTIGKRNQNFCGGPFSNTSTETFGLTGERGCILYVAFTISSMS